SINNEVESVSDQMIVWIRLRHGIQHPQTLASTKQSWLIANRRKLATSVYTDRREFVAMMQKLTWQTMDMVMLLLP
ncbi:MAG: hypothetical protein WBG32_20260, partial [Nodosilinea sp.]